MILPCTHCLLQYDPALAAKGDTDGRGGELTGWFLPDGVSHQDAQPCVHELPGCYRPGCSQDVSPDDGTFCSPECRARCEVECGP